MEKTTIKKNSDKSKTKMQGMKRSTRFKSEPMSLGYIDQTDAKTFKPQLVGILLNESYTGCALILATDSKLKNDQKIKIKVGDIDPVRASIVWIKNIEENIYKIGIKFLE